MALLAHLRGVGFAIEALRKLHGDCDGCDLCRDLDVLDWQAQTFHSLIGGELPCASTLEECEARGQTVCEYFGLE
jgi:hypothetical protein